MFVCLYICLDVRKAFLYFDPRVFVLVPWSTPSQTSLNRILCLSISTHITLEIELFTVLNSVAGAVKTWKLKGLPFLFELVAVVSQYALWHGYKPYATVFPLSTNRQGKSCVGVCPVVSKHCALQPLFS